MAVSGRATASQTRQLQARDSRDASSALLATLEPMGKEIKARLELADKALVKVEDHYRAAGLQLADVKKRIAAGQQEGGDLTFEAFLKQHCQSALNFDPGSASNVDPSGAQLG
jgi:hypothetical protein